MKTTEKKTRQCKLCGKTIEYSIITEDGMDWCGHQRGQSSTRTIGYECDCKQYKKMCRNCIHYDGHSCTNEKTISKYQKKYADELFAIDIKELLIKDANKKCEYWQLSPKVANELFE